MLKVSMRKMTFMQVFTHHLELMSKYIENILIILMLNNVIFNS